MKRTPLKKIGGVFLWCLLKECEIDNDTFALYVVKQALVSSFIFCIYFNNLVQYGQGDVMYGTIF